MRLRSVAVQVCAVVALLAAGWVGKAAGESRNRALARVIERAYSAREAGEIERAFRAAVQAGMDDRDVVDLVETCVDGDFSAQETFRVLSLAGQLAVQELPVDSFQRKIEEGVAKHAKPERIVQVAEKRALALNNARAIVNDAVLEGLEVDDREVLCADVAEALESGTSAGEVRRVLTESLKENEGIGAIRRKLFP